MAGINYSSFGFSETRTDLGDYITENASKYPVIASYPEDIANQILDIAATAITATNYRYAKYREEAYLSSAKLSTSIFKLAKDHSYNVQRASAPSVKATVLVDNLSLVIGSVLGTVTIGSLDLDLIYFGKDTKFVKGDIIPLHIGKYKEFSVSANTLPLTSSVVIDLSPSSGYQIDNVNYVLYKNGVAIDTSKLYEDYIVKYLVGIITNTDLGVSLLVSDKSNNTNYGITLNETDTLLFKYLETTGTLESLTAAITNNTFNITDNAVSINSVYFKGYDREPDSKITRLAPLLYTTAKRCVTPSDFEIIANLFNLIYDCKAELAPDKCCTVNLYYVGEGSTQTPRVLSDSEKDYFYEFYEPYSVGLEVDLISAECVYNKLDVTVYYKASARPVSDTTGVFEMDMQDAISAIISSYNLSLGSKFTVGQIVSDISKLDNITEVHFTDIDGAVIPNDFLISCTDIQYPYISSDIELIARES